MYFLTGWRAFWQCLILRCRPAVSLPPADMLRMQQLQQYGLGSANMVLQQYCLAIPMVIFACGKAFYWIRVLLLGGCCCCWVFFKLSPEALAFSFDATKIITGAAESAHAVHHRVRGWNAVNAVRL